MTVCFALCLNITITAANYRARAQGNVFKHPKIIRKKYISLRTSNSLWRFVEMGDLKMADHCKIWKLRLSPPPHTHTMYRNFTFSCDLTHVQKCAIQILAWDITGSRSGLSCFIIAIEVLQACYYAVMKGVFSFSFQLANLGDIPYVISPWHRFWGKEFSKVLKYIQGLFPWKRQRKYFFVQLNLSLLLKCIMVVDHLKYNFNYNELFRGWSRLSLCWSVRIGFGPMEPVETVSKCYPGPCECSVAYRVPLGWGG